VPLDATAGTVAPYEDPWVLGQASFAPCYIGGWSAAEHWGLTEQLFAKTFVVTAAHVRAKEVTLGGLMFRLARVSKQRASGDATVWRGPTRVLCSSPELTIIDGANSPAWVGGVRHLAEIFARYAETSKHDLSAITNTLAARGRGAAAKRIGFIAETLAATEHDASRRPFFSAVAEAAEPRRTAGVIKLDPAVRTRGSMNTAWGLWINADVTPPSRS
jgi:predicted transcriptional regulator of viral defense system